MKTQNLLDQPADDAPVAQAESLAPVAGVTMFERLAMDPNVSVDKLERLIELQERIMRHDAKAAFEAAYARLQAHIPIIDERSRIVVRNEVRSTYAALEDIHSVIKPILAQYGFAIRHRTEWPTDKPNIIRIIGILGHEQGHSEESIFEAPADRSDFRSDIQSMGSTVSYGRRYTTMDLLNIATQRADNDGQAPTRQSSEPDGYADFYAKLEKAAERGLNILTECFNTGTAAQKTYAANADKNRWITLKKSAQAVK